MENKIRQITVKLDDGTERVVEKGIVIGAENNGNLVNAFVKDVNNIELCIAGVGMLEVIKQYGLHDQFVELLDRVNAQEKEEDSI